jgi:hypothetical protein
MERCTSRVVTSVVNRGQIAAREIKQQNKYRAILMPIAGDGPSPPGCVKLQKLHGRQKRVVKDHYGNFQAERKLFVQIFAACFLFSGKRISRILALDAPQAGATVR